MRHNRKIIYLAGFLFSLPIALTSYINSSFLESYLNSYYISILYAFSSILTIISLFQMPKVLERFGNRRATFWFSIILFTALLLLAWGNTAVLVVPAFVLYWVSSCMIIATLDIFVEDFSKEPKGSENNGGSSVGRFRGLYISIINIAWVLSQIISGSIIAKSSFSGIYILSALFMLLVALIFVFFLHNFVDPKYQEVPIGKTIRIFLHNRNISKIYFVDLAIKFFYSWMIIYTPIYLNRYLGFSWDQIGIIFMIMLVPFVVLSFPTGVWSDKIGEKKLLLLGLFIMSASTFVIPLFTQSMVWMWAVILLCTRIGAAISEAMAESYFFKVISEENADEISFFRNASPVAYIVAPLIAIPVLYFVPDFKYLFFVLSAILLSAFFVTLRLRDVR